MILRGDCLEQMKTLGDNSVDAVVTDPPYGLSFMGKKWDYDVPSVDIWREVYRVLKPGGHVLSFGGTRTYHRMVVNIEDAGFEIRDSVYWHYGSGFPKSHNISKAIDKTMGVERVVIGHTGNARPNRVGKAQETFGKQTIGGQITIPQTDEAKQWDGWGSALKPATEPICLARKPLEKGLTLAENVLKHGTGAINIDGTRIEGKLEGDPNRFKKTDGGWGVAQFHEAPKVRIEGRWPANVLFDEDAAAVLDEQSGQTKSGAMKREVESYDGESNTKFLRGRSGPSNQHGDTGGASRFFYVAKASKRERGNGNAHPTVKPIKLMEYLITLITPPNGTVLDPFTGSGTTGVAAKRLGFNFIGCEMNEEYIAIAEKRIAYV
jgi:DNA modification methylase